MATVMDDVLEDTSINTLEEEVETKVETPQVEDDLPEKYRGKSAKEIALMHQEAEKLIGRQGSEVGELRKVVDEFIKTQTTKPVEATPAVTEEDFFVDPKNAVSKAIDEHPAVKEAKLASLNMKKAETLSKLGSEFPNFMEEVAKPEFAEWIKSSKVRTELYARAETQFDYDSAKELLANWTEKQAINKKVADASKIDREQQLKVADVGTTGSTESVGKKTYRRSDIIRLMQTDPDRYDSMANEIMQAYREGRVK